MKKNDYMKKSIAFFIYFFACTFVTIAQKGPGLGNLKYDQSELFKNIWLYKEPTHYGSNTAALVNGYLVTTFTPDSGKPPGGLLVFDVSDPRSPKQITRIFDTRTSTLREAHAIGNYKNYIAIQDGCGFQIWDMSDAKNPVQAKRFCIPGYKHDDYGSAWQLFWQAPYMYIANGAAGFDVVDVSDIMNPVYVKHVSIGMQAGPIFAIGNLLVTLAHDTGRGYAVLDISDPKNPKLMNTSSGTENIYSGFVNGNRIISSARGNAVNATFSVHDFTDPYSIKLSGRLNIGNSGEQLYNSTQDQYIFQGCQSEIVKIDASDPQALKVTGRGKLAITGNTDHGQVTPFGNLIFVGNDHGSGNGFIVHQTEPDTRGPEVNMISPRTNSVNRALTSRVGVTLTDNVELSTVNNQTFIVRPKGGQALTGKYSHQFSILNFTPDQPLLPNTAYEVIIPAGGFSDWSGNKVQKEFSSFFSTGPSGEFPPASPENLLYTELDNQIDLNWNKVSGATNYIIKRSTNPAGPFSVIGTSTQASFQDTKVVNGVYYYYQVLGENSYGEGTTSQTIKAMPAFYITELKWVSSKNHWGPVEIDQSNGEQPLDDGRMITLNGQQYTRGLGTHAPSEVVFNLAGKYKRFLSDIGIDDEVGTAGSAFFQVLVDGKEVYKSAVLNGNSNTLTVDVNVTDAKELRLITSTDANVSLDHASWGGARLVPKLITDLTELDKSNVTIMHNAHLEQILISSDKQVIEEIRIIDITGRFVYEDKASFSGDKSVQLNGLLKSGMYIITVQSKNFVQSKKLIVP